MEKNQPVACSSSSITLTRCKFFAYHGVGEQEQEVGNHFEVTLKVYCPMRQAMTQDDLNGTVNYSELYTVLQREMEKPSKLPEHVAHRVIQAVQAAFPSVTGGEITISKLTPPFKCDLHSVDVAISW